MHSKNIPVEQYKERITISKTDKGDILSAKIDDLKQLLKAYRDGIIKQSG